MAYGSNPQNTQAPAMSGARPTYDAPGAATAAAYAPTGAPDVYGTSASLYNQAAAGPNIGQFMNPYTSMVSGQALQDLNRQRQMATNDIGAAASRGGAFGGSRHGVAEALTNTGFAQQGANMFANLQSQGFNTALNAAQNQQGIQSNLAGQGFGFGQQLGQQQAAQGGMQQALQQALIDAAKGQYGGFTGAPTQALAAPMAALGQANMGQSTTEQSTQPGLLNYLSLAMGF